MKVTAMFPCWTAAVSRFASRERELPFRRTVSKATDYRTSQMHRNTPTYCHWRIASAPAKDSFAFPASGGDYEVRWILRAPIGQLHKENGTLQRPVPCYAHEYGRPQEPFLTFMIERKNPHCLLGPSRVAKSYLLVTTRELCQTV